LGYPHYRSHILNFTTKFQQRRKRRRIQAQLAMDAKEEKEEGKVEWSPTPTAIASCCDPIEESANCCCISSKGRGGSCCDPREESADCCCNSSRGRGGGSKLDLRWI
jgi:hypothetical protein